jgi:hypothetical protein
VVNQLSWEQLTYSLAARLPRLRDGDTIILSSGCFYTQLGHGPQQLRVEAAGGDSLPADARLSAEQERHLRELGWLPPAPGDANWWIEVGWPVSGRAATEVAVRMISTLRDVYGLDAERIEEKAFNAFG